MLRRIERLDGLDQRLRAVVIEAASRLRFDVQVIEGRRTLERQRELYAQGRTAPGKVVTWTMASPHLEGRAVDLAPLQPDGSIDWKDIAGFEKLRLAMMDASRVVGVRIRSGADWNMNGTPRERGESDSPHFELAS